MTNANERVAYHVGKQLPHSGLSIVVFQHTRRAFILQLRQIISLLIHYTSITLTSAVISTTLLIEVTLTTISG